MQAPIDRIQQFLTHPLLMWALLVQLWIVLVYIEHNGVADIFHQMENRLVALEDLIKCLPRSCQLQSEHTTVNLPRLRFQPVP